MTPYEHDCYAVTHPGLETVLAAELRKAGHSPRIAVDEAAEKPSLELVLGLRGGG